MRPEVGTQAQFKKKLPPKTYCYDSSLSPALDWDGQNPAREQGEAGDAKSNRGCIHVRGLDCAVGVAFGWPTGPNVAFVSPSVFKSHGGRSGKFRRTLNGPLKEADACRGACI
jgi:hypothetical protein